MKAILACNGYYQAINDLSTHFFIGNTGTLLDIADIFGVSRNTVKAHKDCINQILVEQGIFAKNGAYVKYDKKNNTFHFTVPGRLRVGLWAIWEDNPDLSKP